MNKDDYSSEEQLNAFVDGELAPEEKSRLYNEAARSTELDQRLCQQRKVKELVQHAYEDVPATRRSGRVPLARSDFFGRALVAGLLIAVGVAAGFFGQDYADRSRGGEGLTAVASGAATEIDKYLLHVTSGEPAEMLAALEHANYLLDSADADSFRQVEIIANEKGIDMLRSDVTPFAEEIRSLQQSDVVFYACSKTIERLEERGITVRLVPQANPDYTALDRVVTRMQEGWTYEKL